MERVALTMSHPTKRNSGGGVERVQGQMFTNATAKGFVFFT